MKRLKLIIISCMLVSSILLTSCSKKENASTNALSEDEASIRPDTQTFTLDELEKYDGQNGNPAYVAIDGIVYDVSDVDAWKDGKHKNGITAGANLTSEIGDSPHGTKVLEDLPVVGKLE